MALKRTRDCSIPLFLSVAMLLLWKGIEGKDLVVGNQMGWTNYDLSNFEVPNYGAWAISQRAVVGDSVVFKYAKGLHNVNLLPNREAYLSCDFSRARQLDNGASGMYIWQATSPGVYYFGCNKEVEAEGNHCGSGQKLALEVRVAQTSDEMDGVKAELAILAVETPGEAPVPGAAPLTPTATPGAAPVPEAAPPTATATPTASPVPGAAPPTETVSPASSPATPLQAPPAPATSPVSVAPAAAPPAVAPVSSPAASVPNPPPPSIPPVSTPVGAPAIPPPSTPPASPSSPPSTVLSPAPTTTSPPPPPPTTSPTPTVTPPSPSPPSLAPQTSTPSSAPLSPVASLPSPPAPPLSAGATPAATTGAPTPSTSGSSDSGRNLIAAILWGYLIATAVMALMLR